MGNIVRTLEELELTEAELELTDVELGNIYGADGEAVLADPCVLRVTFSVPAFTASGFATVTTSCSIG